MRCCCLQAHIAVLLLACFNFVYGAFDYIGPLHYLGASWSAYYVWKTVPELIRFLWVRPVSSSGQIYQCGAARAIVGETLCVAHTYACLPVPRCSACTVTVWGAVQLTCGRIRALASTMRCADVRVATTAQDKKSRQYLRDYHATQKAQAAADRARRRAAKKAGRTAVGWHPN